MGVVASITRVDGRKLARLCDQPLELGWYLDGSWPALKPQGPLARLFGKKPEPPAPPRPTWTPPPREDDQYLDKAWHAIHYLLTGSGEPSDHPRSFLLSGTTVDLGDSEAIVHDAARTQEIGDALQEVDREWLLRRWDLAGMKRQRVYLMHRFEVDDPENIDYVVDYALELVDFVREAARRNCGLVVALG